MFVYFYVTLYSLNGLMNIDIIKCLWIPPNCESVIIDYEKLIKILRGSFFRCVSYAGYTKRDMSN